MGTIVDRIPPLPHSSGWFENGQPSAAFVNWCDSVQKLMKAVQGFDVGSFGYLTEVAPQNLVSGFGVVIHQIVPSLLTSPHSSATAFPIDNTIPQITEGAQAMAQSFTPKSNASKVRIDFSSSVQASQGGGVGIFRSGQNDALSVRALSATTVVLSLAMSVTIDSWGTSANTISVRTGSTNGINNVNLGSTGSFGASEVTSLVITEYEATPIS